MYKNIKISVVVPVYNVKNYISRCIKSLLNQTISEIELIMIDDGSIDESGRICDYYADQDNRIIVIHKENAGLGRARNIGLELAKGEYIAFIDSDDFIENTMFEELYNIAVKNDADTCFCGHFVKTSLGKLLINENHMGDVLYEGDNIKETLLLNMMGSEPKCKKDSLIGVSVCMGIFSRKIIQENNIVFQSEKEYISEDTLFQLEYLPCCTRVYVVKKPLYYYCINKSSLTKSYKGNRLEALKKMYIEEYKRLQELELLSKGLLRIQRLYMGGIRASIKREVFYIKENNFFVAYKNIKEICSDDTLVTILKSYPYLENPINQRIFSILIKYKLVTSIMLLSKLQLIKNGI